jgi:hypothetical protein
VAKKQAIGFGFIPEETQHHYLIRMPKIKTGNVVVYERFVWDGTDPEKSDIDEKHLKVTLSVSKWDAVKNVVEKEFNRRLQINNTVTGKFKIGDLPLERLFGKELVLLLWAIEDSDPALIPTAIQNWLGLSMEERWWLFTMANASTGNYANKRGWRIAIRYALTDNPVDEKGVQGNLIEYMYKNI